MSGPTKSDDPEDYIDRLDDRSDVDELLEEASDLEREAKKRERKVDQSTANLRDRKEEIEEEIEEIEQKHAGYIDRRREAAEARKEAVRRWALNHKDEVLDGVDGKTYEGLFGVVSFRTVPFNFQWRDKDAVVDALKELGREDLIRREEKQPYKSDLKKEPDLVRRLEGVEPIEAHDEVTVELDA